MKRIVKLVSVIGAIVLLAGCGGITEEESDAIIATAVARSKDAVDEAIKESARENAADTMKQQKALQDRLDENSDWLQELVDRLYERFNTNTALQQQYLDERAETLVALHNDNFDGITAEIRKINTQHYERVKDATERDGRKLIYAVCEADYWGTALWNVVHQLLSYLEGGAGTLESAQAFLNGVELDESYADASGICGVDSNGGWYLVN